RRVQAQQRGPHALDREVRIDPADAVDLAGAQAVVELGTEVENGVDLVQVVRVVHKHLVLGVLGEDVFPEADLRLEGGRTGEQARVTGIAGSAAAGGRDGDRECD